jgi:hypothetical protein
MHPYDKATKAARENLQQAERALADYTLDTEFKLERFKELAQAVDSARRELLGLFSGPWPEKE